MVLNYPLHAPLVVEGFHECTDGVDKRVISAQVGRALQHCAIPEVKQLPGLSIKSQPAFHAPGGKLQGHGSAFSRKSEARAYVADRRYLQMHQPGTQQDSRISPEYLHLRTAERICGTWSWSAWSAPGSPGDGLTHYGFASHYADQRPPPPPLPPFSRSVEPINICDVVVPF